MQFVLPRLCLLAVIVDHVRIVGMYVQYGVHQQNSSQFEAWGETDLGTTTMPLSKSPYMCCSIKRMPWFTIWALCGRPIPALVASTFAPNNIFSSHHCNSHGGHVCAKPTMQEGVQVPPFTHSTSECTSVID